MTKWSCGLVLLMAFAQPALAQTAQNECPRLFNMCAQACADMGNEVNDGCLGACLLDNGCAIQSDQSSSNSRPQAGFPGTALPDSTFPNSTMPDSTLPDSRMP